MCFDTCNQSQAGKLFNKTFARVRRFRNGIVFCFLLVTSGLDIIWGEVETLLLVVIQLCQRNSGKMAENERESLWFPLLDTVLSPQRKWKEQLNMEQMQGGDLLDFSLSQSKEEH